MNFAHFEGVFTNARRDPVIVCHIPNALAAMLGARRGRVLLSHDTMEKQHRHHPDLTLDDYRVLEATLMMGEYRQDTPCSAMVTYTDTVYLDRNYRAALKATTDGRLYCVSFNRLRDRDLRTARRKPFPIIRDHN